ncbi:MAG: ABC transporter ATP-binding protein [Chloroflexi bacterium]|nr:ABC transporter ATP-binding protein [Chloroflexota bacterium]
MKFGSRRIFSAVEFSLSRGECLVATGRNGAGKSTLLRVLSGLLRPTYGQMCLSMPGVTLTYGAAGAPDELRRHIGLSSPDLELYAELTAAENLAFYAAVRGLPSDRPGILSALERVALADRADDRVAAFSSGMRQRLRLLFAVQSRPELLLLDEPGSNLDEAGRELVAGMVAAQLTSGIVILATNDRDEMALGDQMLCLDSLGVSSE